MELPRKGNRIALPSQSLVTICARLSNSVVILVGMLALCSGIPAHGQIVSYLDSNGKRVFVNAEPPSRTPAVQGTVS